METPVGTPAGLADRLARTARHPLGGARQAPVLEGCDPQLGAVPWHGGVVPGQPRQPGAVRGGARGGEEVMAGHEHLHPRTTLDAPPRLPICLRGGQLDDDHLVGDTVAPGRARGMALPDRHQLSTARDDGQVGVAFPPGHRGLGRQRSRLTSGGEKPEALIGPIGQHDRRSPAVGPGHDGVRRAPVLVDGTPGRPPRRQAVLGRPPAGCRHQHLAARLGGTALVPPHLVPRHRHAPQPDDGFDEQLRGDRGGPRTVGPDGGHRQDPNGVWRSG